MRSVSGAWDDEEDEAGSDEISSLDAITAYCTAGEKPLSDSAENTVPTLLFTAMNPPGTVSATSLIDGRIYRIELSPDASSMTPSELSEEIALVSSLARSQAGAAKHYLITEFMARRGRDRVATKAMLEHEMGIPSPESVRERRAASYAERRHLYDY